MVRLNVVQNFLIPVVVPAEVAFKVKYNCTTCARSMFLYATFLSKAQFPFSVMVLLFHSSVNEMRHCLDIDLLLSYAVTFQQFHKQTIPNIYFLNVLYVLKRHQVYSVCL